MSKHDKYHIHSINQYFQSDGRNAVKIEFYKGGEKVGKQFCMELIQEKFDLEDSLRFEGMKILVNALNNRYNKEEQDE